MPKRNPSLAFTVLKCYCGLSCLMLLFWEGTHFLNSTATSLCSSFILDMIELPAYLYVTDE